MFWARWYTVEMPYISLPCAMTPSSATARAVCPPRPLGIISLAF